MPLNLNGMITTKDIETVGKLDKNRPVYLFSNKTEKLVVKNEIVNAGDERNMRYAMSHMKAIDPTMATRQLHGLEIAEIKRWATSIVQTGRMTERRVDPVIVELARDISQPGVWVKTNLFEQLKNLESAKEKRDRDGDKTDVRAIAAALSTPGGLEKLGQMLAVDAFNGNNDRFDMGDLPAPKSAEYHVLANLGNVAVCLQGDALRPVGMDAWSPYADHRSVEKAGVPEREWYGYRLTPASRGWRQNFCQQVAADLETALGPRDRKIMFASTKRLPKDAARRLEAGMEEGIVKLKTKLLSSFAEKERPAGLSARMIALGWAVPGAKGMRPPAPAGAPGGRR